ncbi:MAG: hypothetical protein WA364_24225 [Candidatus Nitrosopolaris sp.]
MCINSTSSLYTNKTTMNKTGVILAVLAIVLAVTATLVTVSLMNRVAHADPFSWGYTP